MLGTIRSTSRWNTFFLPAEKSLPICNAPRIRKNATCSPRNEGLLCGQHLRFLIQVKSFMVSSVLAQDPLIQRAETHWVTSMFGSQLTGHFPLMFPSLLKNFLALLLEPVVGQQLFSILEVGDRFLSKLTALALP
jgi:hypothetical protein